MHLRQLQLRLHLLPSLPPQKIIIRLPPIPIPPPQRTPLVALKTSVRVQLSLSQTIQLLLPLLTRRHLLPLLHQTILNQRITQAILPTHLPVVSSQTGNWEVLQVGKLGIWRVVVGEKIAKVRRIVENFFLKKTGMFYLYFILCLFIFILLRF